MLNPSLALSLAQARQRELLDEAERNRRYALIKPRKRIVRQAEETRGASAPRAAVRAPAADARGC
jgi:hypothetical protein